MAIAEWGMTIDEALAMKPIALQRLTLAYINRQRWLAHLQARRIRNEMQEVLVKLINEMAKQRKRK